MAAPPKTRKATPRAAKRPQIAPQARALEWGLGVISGSLVIALLAYLAIQGIRTQAPPSFRLAVQHVERLGAAYRVAVEVENLGDSTAAEVAVRGEIAGGEPETSETVLDFLPPRSTRETVLLFARDPGAKLTLSVRGYNQP